MPTPWTATPSISFFGKYKTSLALPATLIAFPQGDLAHVEIHVDVVSQFRCSKPAELSQHYTVLKDANPLNS